MIQFYLEKLGICCADKILFVADGARWIWNRVEQLMRSLGIKKWFERAYVQVRGSKCCHEQKTEIQPMSETNVGANLVFAL